MSELTRYNRFKELLDASVSQIIRLARDDHAIGAGQVSVESWGEQSITMKSYAALTGSKARDRISSFSVPDNSIRLVIISMFSRIGTIHSEMFCR